MAVPRNASATSILGQLLEDYAGVLGLLPSGVDLFPAELFDSFCSQNCGILHDHKTPDQYADYTG